MMGFVILYGSKFLETRVFLRVLTLSSSMILVWCLESVVLSGAPLYPSTIGYIHVGWAIPIEKVAEEAKWVYSWARQPGTHPSNVLGNWNWLRPWFSRLLSNSTADVVMPVGVSGLFCAITVAIGCFKRESRLRCSEWAILLPSLIGLIYWFFTAPDPRFAHALFFVTAMCSILLFLSSVKNIDGKLIFFVALSVILAFAYLAFGRYVMRDKGAITSISTSGWYPVKNVPLVAKITFFGLSVYTPKTGDQCWDSPLPCTPYLNDRLRLRNPHDMASGFTVEKEPK
jgi:hypothetical protein